MLLEIGKWIRIDKQKSIGKGSPHPVLPIGEQVLRAMISPYLTTPMISDTKKVRKSMLEAEGLWERMNYQHSDANSPWHCLQLESRYFCHPE